ncbi:MAG: Type 1 glutamine amidotransferase-like domain-containing protein [Candidatus Parcubacteria bacterium]|nr:Type 1 glutamine amidotransferase-like domain-containing protein [Candidatus Parcubacteria bacterium]
MKYYLSSYEIGNETEKLKKLVPKGRIGYIPNARDFTGADPERRAKRNEKDMGSLRELDFEVEMVNLRDYFGKRDELKNKLEELGAIFISGGNVFVLRQAMKLSGLDEILKEIRDTNFLYAGYSAAGCVLAPNLRAYEIVDKVDTPYEEQKEVIWDGLGFVDFAFMPHWDSDHPESADIEKEIMYCKENNILYKAIRDGEVIVIE